jgi:bifunctional DNase/RNase
MSHDLMKMLIERMDGDLDRVVIDDLWNGTYYAKLYIKHRGEELEIDSRPSDAIALAVRFNCPVFVLDSILDVVSDEG